MKNLRSKINDLIRKRLIEETPTKTDYEVFSKIFDFNLAGPEQISNEEKEQFLQNLNTLVAIKRVAKEKIDNIDRINYLGEYISSYMSYYDVDTTYLSEESNFDKNTIDKLINEEIKILEIDPKQMARFLLIFNLSFYTAAEILRKSIFFNANKQSAKNALARYSGNKGLSEKGKSMSSAVNELLYKAHKSKPLISDDGNLEKEINKYISNLKLYYK